MAKHLIITGRVQGVGYRQWMCRQAPSLSLTGWVRNRRDGSVEAVVDGTESSVATLIQRAHRGPPEAKVDGVAVTDVEESPGTGFDWRPTA